MVHDVADFLRRHAPFDSLGERELDEIARTAEIEFRPRGAIVLAQGAEPAGHVWVVRSGAVELIDGGRALDLLGEGEMIGHPSMLSGLPATFEVRAAEDALLYRLPAQAVAGALAQPAGVRFVARTLLERPPAAGDPVSPAAADPGLRPVAALVRHEPVVCAPQTAIRDAALELGRKGASALVVRSPGGQLGIVTDRDLRSRVATGEVPVDAPVSVVMSEHAFTVTPDRLAADVAQDLLERGFRHAPVVDEGGRVLGVLDDMDLLATDARLPFRLRRAVAEAASSEAVAQATRALPQAACALLDAGLAPERIALISAAVIDAATRRLVELAAAELGAAPVEFSWLALGSLGRREPALSSDADCGLVWHGQDADERARAWTGGLASRVTAGLAACGLGADEHGVRADRPLFARSATAWRAALESWSGDPGQEKAAIAASVLFDGRVVQGRWEGETVLRALAPRRPGAPLLTLLGRMALAHRPPTGFRRDVVVAHDGRHRGTFDVKRGGVLPIVDLARWAGVSAGSTATGTLERLRAAADAGVLDGGRARMLAEAWELLTGLRLEHQAECVRSGRVPDDHVDPVVLNPLSRRYLREAFRAVGSVQRHVDRELAAARSFGTQRG